MLLELTASNVTVVILSPSSFEFMARNCIYVYLFIYKKGTERGRPKFHLVPRSVPFEKKGIVTFSFRSFESILNT